ncbi:MAG TPA: hypothetical protein VMB22_04130, partial [Verrucomicrobiae bacterium]|nr:hypothetical protein [Verrucomicrobiae bacterium]
MKRVVTIAICLASGLAWNSGRCANDIVLPANPYAPIIVRNIFGLNPPPPPAAPAPNPADAPPKITPNGIMTIFGVKQVLFHAAFKGRPGIPDSDQSYILAEGQRKDDIEIVKIDDKKNIITFNNHGDVEDLPLTEETSTGSVAANNPNAGGAANLNQFSTQRGRGNFGNGNNNGGGFYNGANSTGYGAGGNYGNNFNSGATGQSTSTYNQNADVKPAIPMDQQTILITAEHMKAIEDNDPSQAIYPPTDLDSQAG